MTESTLPEPVDVGVETPEADAVEQAQGSGPATTPRDMEPIADEVPEADAVEQAQGAGTVVTPRDVRSIPDDVPVADALEQSYEVELDDDYRA